MLGTPLAPFITMVTLQHSIGLRGAAAGLLSAGIVLAVPQVAQAVEARPDGSFLTATLPEEPTDKSGTRQTIVGEVRHNTLSSVTGDAELSITATILPSAATALTTENMLYRNARRELLRNYEGQAAGWGECKHAGHECRLLRYKASDGRKGVARLYLHDGTLVVVNAVYGTDKRAARSFLASARSS